MSKNHLEIESLETLIQAVQVYQEDLLRNRQVLINAANTCDAAMGSDDIVKKHIARLNDALVELDKTSRLAEEVAEALIEDKRIAISVYEEG